jgi:hypothetical protein
MYTTTITAEIAQQHIQNLHSEAKTRRLAHQLTARASRVPTARKDLTWLTIKRFHVTPAH